jgi:hypothetical protein
MFFIIVRLTRLITGVVTRYTRRVPLVEQELFPFRSTWFTPDYLWGSCYSILSFMCMFCRSLLILFSFFFWPLCCLFLFDIRILITPMVSSNFSLKGVSRSRTFKDSQKKANEKTDYSPQNTS